MDNEGEGHVSKSGKVEKRRLHKQKQHAVVTAKLESYEDLEARTPSAEEERGCRVARQIKSVRHPSDAKHDTSPSPQGCGQPGL